ncbi:MAG: hypothetical protein WCG11_03005 [Methylococcaceae bacterium]
MQPSDSRATNFKTSLTAIRRAAADVYLFTDKLNWLKIAHQVALKSMQSVDSLQKEMDTTDDLSAVLASSSSVIFFDDIVDEDIMSELESYILTRTENNEDDDLTQFLNEVLEKIEDKFKVLIKKIHDFNALMKNELD